MPVIGERGVILIPPHFIVRAREQPILALAATAYVTSQVRDYLNGRLRFDPYYISDRADATEAHFLKFALAQEPDLPLTDFHKSIMQRFPMGIDSLSPELRYSGDIGRKRVKADLN